MKYSVKSKFVAAKPRKNRGNTASSGSSDYSGGSGNVVLTGSVESDGHTHANLASLNQIDTNPSSPDGYIYLSSTNKDNGDVVKTKAKSGFSDESAHALTSDEATHADVADIAHNLDDWSVADNLYLSRVNDDTAQGNLSFAKSIQSTAFKAASESFDGAGWAIVRDTNGLSTLVADNLRLRGTLTAHELVVRQVRAICGALGISQACGKVREVDYDAESSSYHLVMEGDATHGYGGFQNGDLIRCQRFTQNGINGYWVQISDVVDGGRILTVQRNEFAWIHQGSGQNDYDCCDYGSLIVNDDNAIITTDDGLYALAYGYSKNGDASYNEACLPMPGDEIVQYGSSINKERQSAIYIHTDANGTPAIDLLEGIKTKSFDGCLRCRLGGVLPDGGFGLYVNNGTILSTNSNKEHYALRPDGSFNLGQGAIKYDPTNGIVTIADNVSINWGASSQEGVEYALSTDGVTPPTSGWTTLSKISSDKGGKYLWTRTRYPNGTYAYSVSYQAVDGAKGDKGDKGDQGIQGEKGDKGDKGDQGIQGLQGLQGERGLQGIQGKDGVNGKDGKTTYFHIKYSSVENPTASQMSETPNKYIGTYVDFQPTDSNDPKAYTWYLFQGLQGKDGTNGLPGKNGVDGKTSYLHIKYSNDGGKTFTSNKGETSGDWIGQYSDYNQEDSMDISKYTWSKIKGDQGIQGEKGDKGDKGDQGIQGLQGLQGERGLQGIQGKDGVNGKDGKTTYFHIKYSSVENPTASQMSETPNKYIGTYVDFQPTDSNDPKAYTWYLFQGLQGKDGTNGLPGKNGVDGKTSYLHIKYSNDGGKTFTSNKGETSGDWIGQYSDYNQEDSMDISKYTWSKIKGDQGIQGEKGDKGDKGDQGIQGLQGLQGIPGKNGSNGNTTYFHIRYSSLPNPTYEGQMSTSPKEYIGTYVDFTKEDSTNPKMYQWYRFQGLQGPQGEQGVPGVGKDGKTSYLHIKYSNDGGKTFTSNNGETIGTWIGVCTDFNLNDPSNVSAYQWSKTKGEQGAKGDKGPQGDRGNDGADGQNMRQNLADYTELLPEIFEKKPDGITLNGTRKVGLDGCGALYAKCATAKDDMWMFQQNVISRLVPNEWYTISFYAKADIASSSIAVYMRSGSTDSVVKLNEVGKLDGKDYTIKSEVVTFALSNVFVRHTFAFKTATTLPNNAYLLFRLFGSIKDAYITQVKLERSSVASDWCRSETDKVAAVNLPDWLDTWNGQTTSANAQYVAARNAFFGVRDTNDKYTGIMMSSEGLKINGESQAIGGLYALSNNEVKIAIDPTKSIYRFQGKVLCDGGQMEGLHVGASLNGITKVNKDNFLEIFSIKSKLSKYYGAPDFYIVNPVIVVESLPTTDTNGNAISGIMLPPYSSGANDYNLALGLLGKTLYIINKSSAEIGISGDCATSFNYAQYLSGGGAKTLTPMSIAEKKIASGKAATYTAHITSSGNIVWVVEANNGGNVSDLNTDFSVLPPSGNGYWKKDFTEL